MAVELAEIRYVVRPRLLLGLHRVAELVGIVASSSLGHWQAALFWELVLHSWAAALIGIRCVVQPRLVLGLQTTMEVGACLAYDGCGTRWNSLRGPGAVVVEPEPGRGTHWNSLKSTQHVAEFGGSLLQTWAAELVGIRCVVQPWLVLGPQRAMEL